MAMTPEKREIVLQYAIDSASSVYDGDEFDKAIDAARADLAAMRQEITAEALVKAEWYVASAVKGGKYWEKIDTEVSVVEGDNGIITVHGPSFDIFHNVTTMYQLGQLVELLGGAK